MGFFDFFDSRGNYLTRDSIYPCDDQFVAYEYSKIGSEIKRIETRLAEITELQKYIGQYGKTKDTYNEHRRLKKYKRTKWEKLRNAPHPADVYYEANRANIALCQAAKDYFDKRGFKGKLPSINTLKQEYAMLLSEKKSLGNIKAAREKMIDWSRAKHNVDIILGDRPAQRKPLARDAR